MSGYPAFVGRSLREANARAWEGRGMRRSDITDPTVSHSTSGLLILRAPQHPRTLGPGNAPSRL